MSHLGLSPPVLDVFPISVRGYVLHVYIFESQYVNLLMFLDQNNTLNDIQLNYLSDALVNIMKRVAANGVLMLDSKPNNTVIKQKSAYEFDVRVIDFDPLYSMFASVSKMSEECILLMNSLIFLTNLYKYKKRGILLTKVVQLVVETYKKLESNNELYGEVCEGLRTYTNVIDYDTPTLTYITRARDVYNMRAYFNDQKYNKNILTNSCESARIFSHFWERFIHYSKPMIPGDYILNNRKFFFISNVIHFFESTIRPYSY